MLDVVKDAMFEFNLDKCPFCGGSPKLSLSVEWFPVEKGRNPVRLFKVTRTVFKIVCECGCAVSSNVSRDDAVRIWQSRERE